VGHVASMEERITLHTQLPQQLYLETQISEHLYSLHQIHTHDGIKKVREIGLHSNNIVTL
jgi:hypothetical protein